MKDVSKLIDFVDKETGDEGFFIVKRVNDLIGVTVSLKTNGDIETVIDAAVASQLSEALRTVTATENG